MKSRYRLIQFVPDHFNGNRYSIGALVHDGERVRVAIAKHIPGAECLGSDASYMLLRHNLDHLRQLRRFESLPMSVGPHFELCEPKEIDIVDADPVKWLEEDVLPCPLESGESKARKRGPSRSTVGLDYLRQFNVARYVKQFRPKRDLHELNGASESLPTISQGVRGDSQLLLMEPVIPTRRQLDRDLSTIGKNFFAYKGALLTHPVDTDVDLVAYVTPGGEVGVRREIVERLSESADRVYDVMAMPERRQLVERVADVGRAGENEWV